MHSSLFKVTFATLFLVSIMTASVPGYATVTCDFAYQWSANGRFLKDDFVRNKGMLFKAKRNVTTEKPDPLNTTGPWEYRGVCASYIDVSAQCDFNGDGQMDLAKGLPNSRLVGAIISAPNQPIRREYDGYFDTGEVTINYGNTSPDTPPDQLWNQNGLGMFPYARPFADFGKVLSTGDFNKDNFCDLAISSPYFSYDVTKGYNKGLVNILYGSPNGLTISVLGGSGRPINPFDAQRFDQDTPGIPEAAEEYDHFGYALASGDFNGDGYSDLAVSAPGEDVVVVQQLGKLNGAGYFHIIYGSRAGLQTSSPEAVGYLQHLWGIPLFEVEREDWYGAAMAAADFDNDGFTDLAISAPGEDSSKGKISLLRGSSAGIDIYSRRDFSLMNLRPDLAGSSQQFGRELRVVDFNADGFKDLEIDFYNFSTAGDDTERIHVTGSASGLIIND